MSGKPHYCGKVQTDDEGLLACSYSCSCGNFSHLVGRFLCIAEIWSGRCGLPRDARVITASTRLCERFRLLRPDPGLLQYSYTLQVHSDCSWNHCHHRPSEGVWVSETTGT